MITLFLYGLGALLISSLKDGILYYIIPIWNWSNCLPPPVVNPPIIDYIIPIWNWSPLNSFCIYSSNLNYIIPIWNWSYSLVDLLCSLHFKLHYSYMELEQSKSNPSCKSLIITLFLYGIGAVLLSSHFQLHLITLFLYGIGANRICKRRT